MTNPSAMQTNNILSADLLDLIFDNRNKEYGAYELRKTYQKRITRAMMMTAGMVTLFITGVVLANSSKPGKAAPDNKDAIKLTEVTEKKMEPPPPVQKKPVIVPVKTVIFTAFKIVDKENLEKPPPTEDDLKVANIGLTKSDGVPYDGTVNPTGPDNGKGVIEKERDNGDDELFRIVEVQAKFVGNWEKFLIRNLDAQVPVEHGAPAGSYTIIIQFVVDKEGNVSDIKPLTDLGYGMEQEAIRVLKKATKWEPAIQNGHTVKAYHSQPITFQVLDNG